jgi:hypothetical protein
MEPLILPNRQDQFLSRKHLVRLHLRRAWLKPGHCPVDNSSLLLGIVLHLRRAEWDMCPGNMDLASAGANKSLAYW